MSENTYPPIELTLREQRALDEEMLAKLLDRPASLAEMFGGMRPRWAVDTIDRLSGAGHVCEVASGGLEVTSTGRAYLRRLQAATRASRPAA